MGKHAYIVVVEMKEGETPPRPWEMKDVLLANFYLDASRAVAVTVDPVMEVPIAPSSGPRQECPFAEGEATRCHEPGCPVCDPQPGPKDRRVRSRSRADWPTGWGLLEKLPESTDDEEKS